ncbi:MAG: DoxX family membrane protein [Actinomycetota bacterium]
MATKGTFRVLKKPARYRITRASQLVTRWGDRAGGQNIQQIHRSPADIAERSWRRLEKIDTRILALLERFAPPLLRLSLGIVFVWFGILKITGQTPVGEMVADTVFWLNPDWFVPLLGVFETLVGVGLLLGRGLRLVLALFVLQMMGTFLVLVVQPDVAFQDGNPLMLTTEGEFVVKNLVLLSAGLMIGSRLRALSSWTREHDGRPRGDDELRT